MKKKTHDPNIVAPLVLGASSGDTMAMQSLMAVYAPYLRKQALIPLYDASGNTYYAFDPVKYQQLEIDFIMSTLQFNP